MADRMKFETPNITAENVAKIAELFPGVVTEGKVNIDLLRAMLGEDVFADEAYEFTWVGKRAAIAEADSAVCLQQNHEVTNTDCSHHQSRAACANWSMSICAAFNVSTRGSSAGDSSVAN